MIRRQNSAFILSKTLLIVAFFTLPVHAQEKENTILIEPATVAMEVQAGIANSQTLTFTNRTGETRSFIVEYMDYKPTIDGSIEYLEAGTADESLKPMIEFTPARFELDHDESETIVVAIHARSQQPAGAYRGVVFVGPVISAETTEDTAGTSLRVAGRIGTLFGVTVADSGQAAETEPRSAWATAVGTLFLGGVLFWVMYVLGRRAGRQ